MSWTWLDRMRKYVDFTPGCWLWRGAIDTHGYGAMSVGAGKSRGAHRVVYEMMVGPIPAGLQLDHLCRVRNCVNPDHLEPVTRKVNILRGEGVGAKFARKTHCPAGHAYDSANTYRRPDGGRDCRTCAATRAQRYLANRKEARC